MSGRRVGGIVVVAAIAAGALSLVALDRRREATTLDEIRAALPEPTPRLVLIGLDGADWQVIDPLIRAGRLPHLAALVQDGARGELISIDPMISPALWTSVATGVGRAQHGIHDFVYKKPGSYVQPVAHSGIRRRLAVWNILSALGHEVGVVNWYASWPADELNGFMLTDRVGSLGLDAVGASWPPAEVLAPLVAGDALPPAEAFPLLERLERLDRAGAELLQPALSAEFAPGSSVSGLHNAVDEDLYHYRAARRLDAVYRPDFLALYFKGIDAASHFFWRYHEPDAEVYGGGTDRVGVELFGSLVGDYYEFCDQLIGGVLAQLDRETVVLVVSDHGFRPFGRPESFVFDLHYLFHLMGLLEFEDPALARDRERRAVRMAGTQLFNHEGTNIVSGFGRRTRAVYLNVRGRDPQGVIDAAELPRVRAEIVRRLEALRTDLGTRVFDEVRVVEEAGAPGVQPADLLLRVNGEIVFDYEILIDGEAHSLEREFLWEYRGVTGTHRHEGVLIARGPAIRRGVDVGRVGLLDVAPTLLQLAGVPVPDDFEGRVMRGLLAEPHAAHPLRVRSYERLVERRHAPADFDGRDEEYLDRLRSLGYTE